MVRVPSKSALPLAGRVETLAAGTLPIPITDDDANHFLVFVVADFRAVIALFRYHKPKTPAGKDK